MRVDGKNGSGQWESTASCKHSHFLSQFLNNNFKIALAVTCFLSQFRYLFTFFLAVLSIHGAYKLISIQMQTKISLYSSDSQSGGFNVNTDVHKASNTATSVVRH